MKSQPHQQLVGRATAVLAQPLQELPAPVWVRALEQLHDQAQEPAQQAVFGVTLECCRVKELVRRSWAVIHEWLHLSRQVQLVHPGPL